MSITRRDHNRPSGDNANLAAGNINTWGAHTPRSTWAALSIMALLGVGIANLSGVLSGKKNSSEDSERRPNGVVSPIGHIHRPQNKLKDWRSVGDIERQGIQLTPEARVLLGKFPAKELAALHAVSDVRLSLIDETSEQFLVHILQRHEVNGGYEEGTRADEEVRRVQSSIREIIAFFAKHSDMQLEDLFVEGLNVNHENAMNERIAQARESKERPHSNVVEANGAIQAALEDKKVRLRGMEDPRIREIRDQFLHDEAQLIEGELTLELLVQQGRLTERQQQSERERLRGDRARYEQLKDRIYNMREDFFLRILTSSKDPFFFVVTGDEHDMKDNVEGRNAKNPEKGLGLITITPSGFASPSLQAAKK